MIVRLKQHNTVIIVESESVDSFDIGFRIVNHGKKLSEDADDDVAVFEIAHRQSISSVFHARAVSRRRGKQ